MTTKINLDYESLQKIIGDDSKVEIDIRQGIVETFARKYLKSIANTDAIKKEAELIRKEILKEVEKYVKEVFKKDFSTNLNYSWNITLNDKAKKTIKKEVYKQVINLIEQETKEIKKDIDAQMKVIKKEWGLYIQQTIPNAIKQEFEKMIEDEIVKRIKKLANNKEV
jgi:tRNA A37 N6-isopentenylltransferase MiaA